MYILHAHYQPPTTPKRYDPNEPPFDPPSEFFNNGEDVDEGDL
ncbi:MAG: hypothetical protein ACOYZ8_07590 [Chloroflexota bacterium]